MPLGDLHSVISSRGHCSTHTQDWSAPGMCVNSSQCQGQQRYVFKVKGLGAPAKKNQLKLRRGGTSEITIKISEKNGFNLYKFFEDSTVGLNRKP